LLVTFYITAFSAQITHSFTFYGQQFRGLHFLVHNIKVDVEGVIGPKPSLQTPWF
jgi:hypothetical protein